MIKYIKKINSLINDKYFINKDYLKTVHYQ